MANKPVKGACSSPCPKCPFRKDLPEHLKGWLGEDRMAQIIEDCVDGDSYFQCHADNSLLCAGAIILDNKQNDGEGFTNSSTRIAVALGWVKLDKVEQHKDKIFDTADDCIEFHT